MVCLRGYTVQTFQQIKKDRLVSTFHLRVSLRWRPSSLMSKRPWRCGAESAIRMIPVKCIKHRFATRFTYLIRPRRLLAIVFVFLMILRGCPDRDGVVV